MLTVIFTRSREDFLSSPGAVIGSTLTITPSAVSRRSAGFFRILGNDAVSGAVIAARIVRMNDQRASMFMAVRRRDVGGVISSPDRPLVGQFRDHRLQIQGFATIPASTSRQPLHAFAASA